MREDSLLPPQPYGLLFFLPSGKLVSESAAAEAELNSWQRLAQHLLAAPTQERLLLRARARLVEARALEAQHSPDAADAWHMAELLWQQVQRSFTVRTLLQGVAAALDIAPAEVLVQQVLDAIGAELIPVLYMKAFLYGSKAPQVLRDWHVQRITCWVPGPATCSQVMKLYAACLLAIAQRGIRQDERLGRAVIGWLVRRAQDDALSALVVRCYTQVLAIAAERLKDNPYSLRALQAQLTRVEELDQAGPPCLCVLALRTSLHCDIALKNAKGSWFADQQITWDNLARALALYPSHDDVEYALDIVRPRTPRGPDGIDGFLDTPEGRRLAARSQLAHAREVAYRLGMNESSAADRTLTTALLQATAEAQASADPTADAESFAARVEQLALAKHAAAARLPWPRIRAVLKPGPLRQLKSLATLLPDPLASVPQVPEDEPLQAMPEVPTDLASAVPAPQSQSLLLRALGRQRGFTLVPGGLERVVISKGFRYGLTLVFYDGSLLGTCDREELADGKEFALPGGGKLVVQLVRRWWTGGRGELHVLHNGLHMLQSDGHPQAYKRQALRGVLAAASFIALVALLAKLLFSADVSPDLSLALFFLLAVLGALILNAAWFLAPLVGLLGPIYITGDGLRPAHAEFWAIAVLCFFYLRSQFWCWIFWLSLLFLYLFVDAFEVFQAVLISVVSFVIPVMAWLINRRRERRRRADDDPGSAAKASHEHRFTMDPSGEQVLVVWNRKWRHFRVTCDDTLICEAFAPEAKKQAARGVTFTLRDGSEMLVQRPRDILFPKLRVLRDGVPVPGSESHPQAVIRVAAAALSCWAVVLLILGLAAGFGQVEQRPAADQEWLYFAVGGIYLGLGFLVERRSRIACIVALLVLLADSTIRLWANVQNQQLATPGPWVVHFWKLLGLIFVILAWREMAVLRGWRTTAPAPEPLSAGLMHSLALRLLGESRPMSRWALAAAVFSPTLRWRRACALLHDTARREVRDLAESEWRWVRKSRHVRRALLHEAHAIGVAAPAAAVDALLLATAAQPLPQLAGPAPPAATAHWRWIWLFSPHDALPKLLAAGGLVLLVHGGLVRAPALLDAWSRDRLYDQVMASARDGQDLQFIRAAQNFVKSAPAEDPRVSEVLPLLDDAVLRKVLQLSQNGDDRAARKLLDAYEHDTAAVTP